MKTKYLFLTIISTFSLFSCDPGMINHYEIDNQSDYDLSVETKINERKRSGNEADSTNQIYLKSSEVSTVICYGEIGKAHDKGDDFLVDVDTIIIKTASLKLKKNIYGRNQWNLKLKKSLLGMDESKYILVLENKDFK